jgi:Cd2+/Zn2+-exporting ATPase
VHYDTRVLSLEQLRAIAQACGAEISEQVGHALWQVDDMRSQRRAKQISEQIRKLPGVIEAVANATGPLRLEYDRSLTNDQALRSALRDLGVTVGGADIDARSSNEHGHSHGPSGKYAELVFVALCGALLLSGWLLPKFAETPGWVSLSIFIPAYFFGGFFAVREAWTSIRRGRFEIDFLMLAAAAGAGALGAWDEGALLLLLFSLGHALEGYAMGRAKNAIAALGDLTPKVATVRRDGGTEVIAVDELSVGDTVIIKPNERIAADGFVIVGQSSVNQAPITGESVPVDKSPVASPSEAARRPQAVDAASQVLAGTINGSGVLEIQVTRASGDSTLARVVALVSETQTNQSPTQRLTERFERIFVPSVLVFTGLLLGAGLVIDEPFSATFYRAMAVLVAASPCALAIATPSAVLSGVARAARGGVLVKGGAPLEQLGRLQAIAFDKTGTLTEGKPRLVDVVAAEGVGEEELLRVAIAVEKLSDHPLAAAVVRDGAEQLTKGQELTATELRSITGRGVQASVDGEAVYVGKRNLFDEIQGPPMPEALRSKVDDLELGGRTTMVIRKGSRYLGVLGLMDTPRAAARSVIERLRQIGVRRMLMISGDNQRVADAVAKEVGLDEALGDLMPDDKVETIKSLRSESEVAMVGDGVNDAPAMVSATVGIAMGAAGSDVALETADVALMADNLNHLPFAVGLSRAASRVIRQNLWLSLGIVALLIPATLLGLGLGPAVMVHEGSTLVVVANALRLLRFQPRGEM